MKSSLQKSKDYLSVTYSEIRAPKSDYPNQLVHYLMTRFRLKPGQRFLEIGCGRGDFLKQFQASGLDCAGLDREASAKEYSKEIEIKTCDISKDRLPFEDETFDVVYHKSVIEHVYSPEHLMKETLRILKKGGKCIILTPDWVSQKDVFYEDITHCRPYDVAALRDAFTLFGFKNVQVEKFNQLPVIWDYPQLKKLTALLGVFLNVRTARFLTQKTQVKFFRWAVELMVLGYAEKP